MTARIPPWKVSYFTVGEKCILDNLITNSYFLVNEKKDLENDGPPINPNLPFPKSIFLIVGNEFCERFSYYGMRSNSKF